MERIQIPVDPSYASFLQLYLSDWSTCVSFVPRPPVNLGAEPTFWRDPQRGIRKQYREHI